MSKSDTFENNLLALIFNGTAITGIAMNTTTSPLTSLYVALHTSDPGEAGTQTTNEVTTSAYAGYVRVAVARSSAGWTVNGASVSPANTISFPACTGGTGATITYFSIGTAATGAGVILYSGTVSPNIAVTSGVTPQLTTASTITED